MRNYRIIVIGVKKMLELVVNNVGLFVSNSRGYSYRDCYCLRMS